jgi:predicted RNase H-like nuclease (RuvC/YqgF family)
MKKSKLTASEIAKKQRRQLAAKARRARRAEKLAELVKHKVRKLAVELKNLRLQLSTKDREIEALKGSPAPVEATNDQG